MSAIDPSTFTETAEYSSGVLPTSATITASSVSPTYRFEVKSDKPGDSALTIMPDGTIKWADTQVGLNWATNLSHWEVDNLRRLINLPVAGSAASTIGQYDHLIGMVIGELRRAHQPAYSMDEYSLAREIVRLLLGKETSNSEYSSRVSVAEVDLMNMRAEMKALKEAVAELRDDANLKDELWGAY